MKNSLNIKSNLYDFNIIDNAKNKLEVRSEEIKVFVSGNFNILLPGHLRLLKYAKGLSDKFIQSNIWVDNAFIIDEPVNNVIRRIKPEYVVKGKEHEGVFNPEETATNSYGGKLVFCSGESSFSSSYLIQQDLLTYQKSKNNLIPKDYFERHKLSYDNLNKCIKNFSKLKVCVIGDLIVDEYIDCQPLGMSQEDPTIVVSPEERRMFLGGAGIVAAHASSLGAKTTFMSVLGKDEINKFVKTELNRFGVNTLLVEDESRPTSLKQRFRAETKTLLRVSNLHQNSINFKIQSKIIKWFENFQKDFDLIVFSDFNYGCLPTNLVSKITKIGKKNGTIMAAKFFTNRRYNKI